MLLKINIDAHETFAIRHDVCPIFNNDTPLQQLLEQKRRGDLRVYDLEQKEIAARARHHPETIETRKPLRDIITHLDDRLKVAFYNKRGTAEQHIKEGKNAIKWTRLSCRRFRNNAVRLQLHALAYNLANFMRTLALPKEMEHWSLTTLREKLVKIGAKVVVHGRYVTFQLAEVAIPKNLFAEILRLIAELRPPPDPAPA